MCTYEHVHGTRDHVNANSGIAYTLSGPQAQPTDNWTAELKEYKSGLHHGNGKGPSSKVPEDDR